MRRALLPAVLLGIVAGVLFIYHDAIRLSTSWPVILGFALWEMLGHRGRAGLLVAAAGAVGIVFGYGTFALVAEFLPITGLSFGIVVGVAVGLLLLIGLLARARFPLAGMLVGYATFLGIFEPRWIESVASIRTHGIESATVSFLALVLGILAAAIVRALADPKYEEEEYAYAAPEAPRSPMGAGAPMGGGAR